MARAAVASPKNIAGAERLARDIAHTEKEITYYLDIIDEMVAQVFEDQPPHEQPTDGNVLIDLSSRRRYDLQKLGQLPGVKP